MKKILLPLLSGIFIYLTLISFTGVKPGEVSTTSKSLQSIYNQQWTVQKYGNPTLEMALPAPLRAEQVEIPDGTKPFIERMELFSFELDSLHIKANNIAYKPEIMLGLNRAANTSLNEIKKQPDIEDFTYSEIHDSVSTQNGIIQSGYFTRGNLQLEFHNIVTIVNHTVWQVYVEYKAGSIYGDKIKDKVVASIKI